MIPSLPARIARFFLLTLLFGLFLLTSACAPCQKVRWCFQAKNPPPVEEEIVEASAAIPIDVLIGLEGKF